MVLNSAELEIVTTSRSPTTVVTPNGEVQTNERPQFTSKNWIFLDNESLRGFASSFIARKALRWTRIFIRVDQRSKTTSHLKRLQCNTENFVPIVVPGLSASSSSVILFNIHDTFKVGDWSSYVFLKLVYLTTHDIFNCVKRKCG